MKYSKKFNLGNYESEEFGIVAALGDDDIETTESMFNNLKKIVAKAHAGRSTKGEDNANGRSGNKIDARDTGSDQDSSESDENAGTESARNDDADADTTDDSATTKKKKSKFKVKAQAYDRTIETHKELYVQTVAEINPDWKKSDKMRAKVKAISEAMEGQEFLDADGVVLAAFRSELIKKLGVK